jgi:type I site-specific restriction endonuclease
MKWLFAGDTLAPDALERLDKAAHSYPEAKLIVAEYEIVNPDNWCWRRHELPSTQLVHPAESMKLAVTKGNWFGAPIAQYIHRDAVKDGFDFGAFPWSADYHFCLEIAAKFPVLYLADPEPVGKFVMRHRRYHREHEESHQSALQDAIVRLEAARHYKQMTGDSATFEKLVRQVEEYVEAQTIQRAVRRNCTPTEVREIARQLRLREMVSLLADEVRTRLSLRAKQRKQA